MFAAKNELFTRPSGYTISRSVRLRSSASAYFSRTPASAGNRTTWTWSGWVKRGALGNGILIDVGGTANNTDYQMLWFSSDTIDFHQQTTTGYTARIATNAVYRDPSAWYHIVAVWNSSSATSTLTGTTSDRMQLWVNGVQVNSFATTVVPAQNLNSRINLNALTTIGQAASGTAYSFDGYLAEVNFIDGQALTPSSFGETNAVTGVWQAKKYSGTYGTNGFYLNFSDNSSNTATTIGKDYSGNGNNWTPNNISVTSGVTYDSMIDSPTVSAASSNYAVLNPVGFGANGNRIAISNGNLAFSDSSSTSYSAVATFAPTSGKWYCEMVSSSTGVYSVGLIDKTTNNESFYRNNGAYSSSFGGGGTTGYSSWTTNDVVSIAWDVDAGKIWFAKNGVWQSGSPSAGTSPTNTFTAGLGLAPDLYTDNSAGTKSGTWNFGAGSGFTYTPPSGFNALNTFNLPTPTIVNGATVMAATLYTGTSGNVTVDNSVNGVSFKPDFLWVKARSNAQGHSNVDSVRGVSKLLQTNLTNAESTLTNPPTINSNGFTSTTDIHTNGYTYVAWQWQAGQGTTSSNTNGSITSTVSVNATAGFSIVTYTGTGANATVGHGLGVAPSMVIAKQRDGANSWQIYHSGLTNASYALLLESTSAQFSYPTGWNSTAPTSTVFSIGTSGNVNTSTKTYVAYCFAAVAGYSAFGSYTGNGSSDGPFVYLGFRPRLIMLKRTDTTGNWTIYDSSRNPYNAGSYPLYPNLSNAEDLSTDHFDWLSNGFKMKSTNQNTSGGTFIYMAFASNPFKNSLAV